MSFECRCIRTDRYKYVWNLQEVDELYDIQEDPIEMKNLSVRSGPRRDRGGSRGARARLARGDR